MPPTVARIRDVAAQLRAHARALDLDLDGLARRGDHRTWEGPAATSYRRLAVDVERRGAEVTNRLRRLAEGLERRADLQALAEAAEAAEEEERRRRFLVDRPEPTPSTTVPGPTVGETLGAAIARGAGDHG